MFQYKFSNRCQRFRRDPNRPRVGSQERSRLRIRPGVTALLLAVLALVPSAATASSFRIQPAAFTTKTDALGYIWDIKQNGSVYRGTDTCFRGRCGG